MGPVGQPSPQLLNAIRSGYGSGRRGFMNEPEPEKPMWEKILGMIGGLGLGGLGGGGGGILGSPLLGAIKGIQDIFKQVRPEEQLPMGMPRPRPFLYNYRRR